MMSPYQVLHVVSQSYLRRQGFCALKVINMLRLPHIRYPENVLCLCGIQVVKSIGLELFINSFVMFMFDPPPSFEEFLAHIVVMTNNCENFGVFGQLSFGEKFTNRLCYFFFAPIQG